MSISKPFPSFIIREVHTDDLPALLNLAQTPGMFSLPSQPDRMKDRIRQATQSFRGRVEGLSRSKYLFVAEELATGKIVATSTISGQHGTEESPHFYFKVGTENRFSSAIQTGFIHGTLTLMSQTDGPTELGGLVVDEDYRGHVEKVGRQVFFSRLLYLYLHPKRFKQDLLTELLPPLNKKANSPLWEAVGRRFTNLDYWEADELSSQNKDFIYDLFPQGKIYTTFLPADARNAIGRVSKNTEPVLHLMKRIGFRYENEIDPFDGGPHLRAKVSDVAPLNHVKVGQIRPARGDIQNPQSGLITPGRFQQGSLEEFKAIHVEGEWRDKEFFVNDACDFKKIQKELKLEEQDSVVYIPYFVPESKKST